MNSNYCISLRFRDADWLDDAKGVLIPIPPTTAHQSLTRMDLGQLGGVLLKANNARQWAWWIEDASLVLDKDICFYTCLEDRPIDMSDFTQPLNKYTQAHDMVKTLLASDLRPSDSSETYLQAMVDLLETKFQYHHGYSGDELPPLSCDIVTGNCLDINTVFMQMLALADIPAAYYIGYFFEEDKPFSVDDWHCWVSTVQEGKQSDWDIAHHLKRRLSPVKECLNPVPGVRFAMSCGRGLQFLTPDNQLLEIGHLGLPRAILASGKTKECLVTVKAERLEK